MCDASARLIAWLDGELPPNEGADIERHLHVCADCRSRLTAYKRASGAFDAYCEAVSASQVGNKLPPWAPVLSGVAAAAAVAILLAFPRPHAQPPRIRPSAEAATPAIVFRAAAAPVKKVRRRHPVAPVQRQEANWLPAEPAIQIAIPADAMFPPGAIPEGVHFIADVSIAADGSAQRLRMRP